MNSIIVSPHDKMVKAALKNIEVAREYFQHYLPKEVLNAINLNILERCPTTHINKFLKSSESDVIYKTEILGSGEECYIYLANEHQSTDTVFMPLRVLEYNVSIWQHHKDQNPKSKKLPLIINVVYYTGQKPYQNSTDFRDLLAAPKELIDAFWSKPFILIQAQSISDDELMHRKWSGLFMYAMKHIKSPDLLAHIDKILKLMKAIDTENSVEYIEATALYTLTAGEISNTEEYIKSLKNGLSEEVGRKIMTGAEQLIEIGEKRGALLGERTLLKRLLAQRFGAVPANYLKKIEGADADNLLQFGDKLIEAKTLEDVFNTYH